MGILQMIFLECNINIHLWQYCCLSQTGLEAPEDPGDAVHLVVGEPLQLGVHADQWRGR